MSIRNRKIQSATKCHDLKIPGMIADGRREHHNHPSPRPIIGISGQVEVVGLILEVRRSEAFVVAELVVLDAFVPVLP